MKGIGRRAGVALTVLLAFVVIAGDRLAPNSATEQFHDRAWAPPMRLHFSDGVIAHPLVLSDRLARTFREDESRRIAVSFFSQGRVIAAGGGAGDPLLLLGGDALGRDIFARITGAARWSLGVAVVGAFLSVLAGTIIGAIAASGVRFVDRLAVSSSTALTALPAVYVVLVLRAALPLVLTPLQVFVALSLLLGLVGWPTTAWAVRGILLRERALDYAAAARAAGASRARLLFVHLLPAARGYLVTQFLVLVPGFLIAEVTLSYLGLGFPEPTPSWGTMLQDAGNVRVISEAPWMLAPAAAIALTSIALHLAAGVRLSALTAFSRPR